MRLKSTYNFVRGLGLKGGGWIYLTGDWRGLLDLWRRMKIKIAAVT